MRVAFLGFGLIAGSIARVLREDGGDWSLVAWSPTGTGARRALDETVLDATADSPADALRGADLVILAAPPLGCLDLLDELAGGLRSHLGPRTLITDVASTKAALCDRARANRIRYVGGHPMAGREATGYASADAGLFRDRPWVVVADGATEDDVARVEDLARTCRARPIRLDAVTHDAATAAVSHLPLVTAAALVETVVGGADELASSDWPTAAALAATGWRDATRLARGDVTMATGIAVTNAAALATRVRGLRDALDEWLTELERPGGPDPDRIEARFAAARERLLGSDG